MEIRLARPEDYPAIGRLTVAAYVGDGLLGPDDVYLAVLRDAAARAAGAQLWVAADGSRLLGTVTYCPVGSTFRELGGEEQGEFRTLAVAPEGRGRGVGRALVRHCLALARVAGHESVVISTLPEMRAAHAVYRAVGFDREPDRDWEPLPGRTLWAFGRALSGADLSAERSFEVTDDDTAAAVGSGSLPVLGTPRLLAWAEAVTCAALHPLLPDGATSVGVRVELDHLRANAVGDRLLVRAESESVSGRTHVFAVAAQDSAGREMANGRVTRVIVDSGRFLERVSPS